VKHVVVAYSQRDSSHPLLTNTIAFKYNIVYLRLLSTHRICHKHITPSISTKVHPGSYSRFRNNKHGPTSFLYKATKCLTRSNYTRSQSLRLNILANVTQNDISSSMNSIGHNTKYPTTWPTNLT
jgi:hypothetical protein